MHDHHEEHEERDDIYLSPEKKQEIRDTLVQFIKDNPITKVPANPVFAFFKKYRYPVALACLLVVFLTGGTGFIVKSAEDSLPESPFYPIKINILEPLKKQLAASREQKSDVFINSANERLQESIQLKYIGRLNAQNISFIQGNFSDNASQALSQINNIGDTVKKDAIKDTFKKSLMEKEDALISLSGQDDDINKVEPLLGEIHKVIKSLSDSLPDSNVDDKNAKPQ